MTGHVGDHFECDQDSLQVRNSPGQRSAEDKRWSGDDALVSQGEIHSNMSINGNDAQCCHRHSNQEPVCESEEGEITVQIRTTFAKYCSQTH